jgi:hypothetical protein
MMTFLKLKYDLMGMVNNISLELNQIDRKGTPIYIYIYIYNFKTSGNWQTITIPLSEMVPSFRGRKLDMPNYPAKVLEEVVILISNKKAERFSLEIDKITLE